MAKSPDAFRTISEVADWLGIQAHVLRFWESKFTQVKPIKRAGGRRYYRPSDMLLLGGIKKLLHEDGMTIKGVQKILREEGMSFVADKSEPLDELTLTQIEAEPEPPAAPSPEPAEKGVVLAFAPPAAAASEEAQAEEDTPQEVAAGQSDTAEDATASDLTEDAPNPVEQVMQDHAAIQEESRPEDTDLPQQEPSLSASEDMPPSADDGAMPIDATASTPATQASEAQLQEPSPVDAVMDSPAKAADRLPEAVDDSTQPVPATDNDAEPVAATDLLSLANADVESADPPAAETESDPSEAVAAPTDDNDSPPHEASEPLDAPASEDDTPSLPGFIQTPLAADDSLPAVDAPMARDNPPPDAAPAEQAPTAVEEAPEQPAFFDSVESPAPTEPEAEPEPETAKDDTPRPQIVEVPPVPTESELHVMPSALTFATRFPNITPAKAAVIRPLLDQLTALRDSMAGRRGDGPPPGDRG